MNRVSAEVSEEIAVFFQNSDLETGASQDEAQHHAGWSAARYDAILLNHSKHLEFID